jgi:hypothetical protein
VDVTARPTAPSHCPSRASADGQALLKKLIKVRWLTDHDVIGLYPASPDHSVKKDSFELLYCADIGMDVTESLAMTPAASVSGFHLGHPEARYFSVGRIGDDQLKDLAARRHMDEQALQRLLAPNL